jgi:hypothetical protein
LREAEAEQGVAGLFVEEGGEVGDAVGHGSRRPRGGPAGKGLGEASFDEIGEGGGRANGAA